MADKRKPDILLSYEDAGGRRTARLYGAGQFPGQAGASPGLYRLMLERSWHCPAGQKYAFLTLAECFAVLAGLSGAAVEAVEEPDLPPGSLVRVFPEGRPMPTLTRTKTIPFQGADGRWRVFVALFDEPFLVDDDMEQLPMIRAQGGHGAAAPHLSADNTARKRGR